MSGVYRMSLMLNVTFGHFFRQNAILWDDHNVSYEPKIVTGVLERPVHIEKFFMGVTKIQTKIKILRNLLNLNWAP